MDIHTWFDSRPGPVVTPREPALEAALRAARHDPAAFAVYADWLLAHGNPLGQLVAMQLRAPGPDADGLPSRAAALIVDLQLPPPELFRATWRWGFWDGITLFDHSGGADGEIDTAEVAAFVFAHTACAALARLHIAYSWRRSAPVDDAPEVLRLARGHAWTSGLEVLVVDEGRGCCLDVPRKTRPVGRTLSTLFPRLTELTLRDEASALDGLDLPQLRRFMLDPYVLTRARVGELLTARLPSLTCLELWTGPQLRGADITLEDLEPLFSKTIFPNLNALGICNSEHASAVARALPDSVLATRLESLDLSRGTLTDEGAHALARGAERLPCLSEIIVSESFLSPDGIAELRRAFPRARIAADAQRAMGSTDPAELWVVFDD